jgi:hypothetical protein
MYLETVLSVFLSPAAIAVYIVIAVLAVAGSWIRKKKKPSKSENISAYSLKPRFLTEREASFFNILAPLASSKGFIVFAKPRIADFVNVTDGSAFWVNFNKIAMKHIDFLLCDKHFSPVMGFEVDDKTHSKPDRAERDKFVDNVYKTVGLPIFHVTDWSVPSDILQLICKGASHNTPL